MTGKSIETLDAGGLVVQFCGEQDGPDERDLKNGLAPVLAQYPEIERAYLAKVRYGRENAELVTLCLATAASDLGQVAKAVSVVFSSLFNHTQSLDMLPVTSELEEALASVCRPFYCRQAQIRS